MVEVLVAVSIISISILAVMVVAQKSIQLSQRSLHASQAIFLLEEGAEAVRIIRDNNWTNISDLSMNSDYYLEISGNTWILTGTVSTLGRFTRTVQVSNVNRDVVSGSISSSGSDDPGTKLVLITVAWMEGGQNISKTLSFYLMNIFS